LEDKRSDNELEHRDRTWRCSRSAGLLSSFWRHPRGQSVAKQFVDDRRLVEKFAEILQGPTGQICEATLSFGSMGQLI